MSLLDVKNISAVRLYNFDHSWRGTIILLDIFP